MSKQFIRSLGLDVAWDPFVGCTPAGAAYAACQACVNCWAATQEDGRLRHLRRCRRPISLNCQTSQMRRALGRAEPVSLGEYFSRGPVRQPQKEWDKPLHWREPRTIAVGFRTDLFHKDISDEDIRKILDVANGADQHVYVTTTKRVDRLADYLGKMDATYWPNWWQGISANDQATADEACRVLGELAAYGWHTFLIIEPMLGPILFHDIYEADGAEGINSWVDGVIVGGESGKNARPMDPDWVRRVRDECKAAGVPFCFKQGWGKNKKNRILDGRTHVGLPWKHQTEMGDSGK